MEIVTKIISQVWVFAAQMAPLLLFGYFLAGVLHVVHPSRWIYKTLSGGNIGAVFKSALFGVPLPVCSCGVIPLAAHLKKNGASDGATVSFLVSTPTTGVDSIFATYSLLGPVFAVARPLIAFISGVLSGTLVNWLVPKRKARDSAEGTPKGEECNVCDNPMPHSHTLFEKFSAMIKYGFFELVEDTSKWLVIGFFAGGIITLLLPKGAVASYLAKPFIAYPLVLAIAIPMYVCATGSIPIAAALIAKGMAPGAALVFLIAGPATNTATISFVAGKLGGKVLVIYLAVILMTAFAFGMLLDTVFADFDFTKAVLAGGEMFPSWVRNGAAALLFALILNVFARKAVKKRKPEPETKTGAVVIKVPDISCKHCVLKIENAITSAIGEVKVSVVLKSKMVRVEGTAEVEKIKDAITNAGYTPEILV